MIGQSKTRGSTGSSITTTFYRRTYFPMARRQGNPRGWSDLSDMICRVAALHGILKEAKTGAPTVEMLDKQRTAKNTPEAFASGVRCCVITSGIHRGLR